MSHINDRLLVTGTSGQLGRAVVEELLRRGATRIVAASRHPEQLGDLQKRGVEVCMADFEQPATLASAFAGVDRLAFISTDAVDVPGKRLAQHRTAVTAAAESGIRHVIYTSAPAPHPTAESSLINDHFWTEAALFVAPFTWTILRNELYMENVLPAAEQALKSGAFFTATAGRGRAYISREDCARTLAEALLGAEGSEILDVTGSAAVTQDELALLLSELTGKTIKHVNVSVQSLAESLSRAGLPPHSVKLVVDFDVDAAQGYHDVVTNTVERLTGLRPMTLREFLNKHLTISGSPQRELV